MQRKVAVTLLLGALAALVPGLAVAQDLHKAYLTPSGGQIAIRNISGDIKVSGYNGTAVLVDAFKVGRDRDLVQIEDLSTADRVELRVQYPKSCNCDASVNFVLHVPSTVDYNFDSIGSVSGGVEITGVRGSIKAESVSGDVVLADVNGTVRASSVSGNVDAQITRVDGPGELKFSSVSGSVNVKAPLALNADVDMSSVSGSVSTDFPIDVRKDEFGPAQHARGRLGSGANTLRITTVSGKVSLTRN